MVIKTANFKQKMTNFKEFVIFLLYKSKIAWNKFLESICLDNTKSGGNVNEYD